MNRRVKSNHKQYALTATVLFDTGAKVTVTTGYEGYEPEMSDIRERVSRAVQAAKMYNANPIKVTYSKTVKTVLEVTEEYLSTNSLLTEFPNGEEAVTQVTKQKGIK